MTGRKETRPTHTLAGERVGRAVMRNEDEAKRPRSGQGSVDVTGMEGLGESSLTAQDRAQQRLAALENANLTRVTRAQTRRALRSGALDFDTFLDESPDYCKSVAVWKILTWLPGVGRHRAEVLMSHLKDAEYPGVQLGELSQRDKYTLSKLVSGRMFGRGRRRRNG